MAGKRDILVFVSLNFSPNGLWSKEFVSNSVHGTEFSLSLPLLQVYFKTQIIICYSFNVDGLKFKAFWFLSNMGHEERMEDGNKVTRYPVLFMNITREKETEEKQYLEGLHSHCCFPINYWQLWTRTSEPLFLTCEVGVIRHTL